MLVTKVSPGCARAATRGSDRHRVARSPSSPTWSPDGSLLLASDDEGWFTVRPDGTGRTELPALLSPEPRTLCCPVDPPSWQPLPSNSPVPTVPTTPTIAVPETTATAPELVRPPASELKEWLADRADDVAFVVSSPTPTYWRLTALSDFDGTTWGFPESVLSDAGGPLAPGFEPDLGGETVTQSFEIAGLDGALLPAAFTPVRVDSAAPVRFDPESSTLVATSGDAEGVEYTVESLLPRYGVASLRAANAAPTGTAAERHLSLPANFPAALAEQARTVTAGAPTRYDQALALQNWFHGFLYDLSVPAGHSQAAMLEFVEQRRGYCEQFAGTYAALARAIGLPSRVAVGFTPGEQGPDGRYHVRFEHAHAWPEIYFEGIGWVPFEPTPGRGSPDLADYTGIPAAQADDRDG